MRGIFYENILCWTLNHDKKTEKICKDIRKEKGVFP